MIKTYLQFKNLNKVKTIKKNIELVYKYTTKTINIISIRK